MRVTKRLLSALLALTMVFSLVPATLLGAAAQEDFIDVKYLYYTEDGTTPTEGVKEEVCLVEGDAPNLSHEWYVARGVQTFDVLNIMGDVHLILKNGCKLTVNKGIRIASGNSLSIYAQPTEGDESVGQLFVTGDWLIPGIGGGGAITINGGEITATSGPIETGIGYHYDIYESNNITINGGKITATGTTSGIDCNRLAINGGTVSATSNAANVINAREINITGGNVDVFGSEDSSAIRGFTVSPRAGYVMYITDGDGTFIDSPITSITDISSIGIPEIHIKTLAVHNVTVTGAENGTVQTDKETAVSGDVVTLTATPDEGYVLAGWESEDVAVGTDGTFTMPDKDVTVTPVFAKAYQKAHLVMAPTVAQNGTYNRHEYYLDTDGNPVVTKENVWDEANSVDFGTWFLRTMVQYKEGEEGAADVRLISMLDEHLDEYMEAGFFLTVGGEEIDPISTTVANKSFLSSGKTVSIGQYSRDEDHFFLENMVFSSEIVTADPEIRAIPYVTLLDGATLTGDAVSFRISSLTGSN